MLDLVIGGGGFIGRSVVDALLSGGHTVRVFDRAERGANIGHSDDSRLEWHAGRIQDTDALDRSLDGVSRVFHFASTTVPKTSDDDPAADVADNLVGTVRLLDLCVAHRVGRVVFLSSGGTVYGAPRTTPIREDHPTDPVVSYGIHKLAIEKYLELYRRSRGLDYRVLRLANPYGPRQLPRGSQGVIAAFMQNALLDRPIEIWGDGSVTRDYVFIDDVANAIVQAADHTGECRLMNIGSGTGVSLRDLIGEIGAVLGRPLACSYKPGRPFDIPVNVLDATLARKELGWRPAVELRSGLIRTRDWMLRELIATGTAAAPPS